MLAGMKDLQSQLIESDGFLIASLGSEAHRRFAECISQWNLGMYQQAVLTTLATLINQGVTSQKQLGDLTGIDPRNLVPVIDTLEERQLVERIPDPADRRRFTIKLTAAGRQLAGRVTQSSKELEENMFESLNKQEKATLHKLLLKLHQAVNNIEANKGAHRESKK